MSKESRYDPKAIGLRIAKCREAKNLTLTELEELTGLNRTYLSKLEMGQRQGKNIETLCTIAKALDVNLDVLLADCIAKNCNANTAKTKYDYTLEALEENVLKMLYDVSNEIINTKIQSK